MRTVILLFISNVFMTTAWYWHLKVKDEPIWKVVLISWFIALFEYCLAVPANRIGSYQFSAFQLKIMQEVISLLVFVAFVILYLKEQLRWNYVVGFILIIMAVWVVFKK